MKRAASLLQITFLGVIISLTNSAAKTAIKDNYSSVFANTVEGTVWNPERQPVPDVYVELQNELFTTISRVRTSSSGRFSFTGMAAARYVVKVFPGSTNYSEYSENIEFVNYTFAPTGRTSSDTVYLEIQLKYDKRKFNSGVAGITDAVFAQEVPEDARKLYKEGVKDIDSNKGITKLEEALKIFPDYYDALNALGREYTEQKEYQKALPYLIKSVQINQRSFSSFYALGYSCYKLNHRPEGLEAARGAVILQPDSVNAQLLYGTLLRLDGNVDKAEKALLQAKTLSKQSPVAEISWQLALLYNRNKRNKEAVEELKEYLKLKPDAENKKEIQGLIEKLQKEIK